MFASKKGLSDVVTTVLIILLALAAVAILWGYLSSFISSSSSQITTVCLTLDLKPISCNISSNSVTVRYGRGAGQGNLTNVSLIFDVGGNTRSYAANNVPSALEIYVQTIEGISPSSFSVAGRIQTGASTTKLCPQSVKIKCGAGIGGGGGTQGPGPGCTESWTCGAWTPTPCTTGQTQTRTCTDSNNCGTIVNRPALSQTCATTCTSNWVCGAWSACVGGQQTRTCTDSNSCSPANPANPNPTTQSCTSSQTPYGGTAVTIPSTGIGTIEIENYDEGGESFAYHDSDASQNGGSFRASEGVDISSGVTSTYNMGWFVAGEWTEYTVNFANPSKVYTIQISTASPDNGGTYRLTLDGVPIASDKQIPNSGAWTTYVDSSFSSSSAISGGTHILRIEGITDSSGGYVGDVDWIKFW